MKSKMKKEFLNFEGGLFSEVEKADVGDSYTKMAEAGVALMGWADPFMPDFSIPSHIMDKTIEAIKSPISSHYTAPTGNMELREVICSRFLEKYGVEIIPERNVIITPGSDSALFFAMFPFLQKDDEVIIPCPSYPNNMQNIKMMQATPVVYKLESNNDYQIEMESLEALVTDKTKMIVLTHPNNPTTTVYSKESLEAIRTIVLKYNLVLVCDQAFDDFTFENEYIAPMSLPDMFEHTITVCSISKGMGLSGYRVGYIIASDKIMDVMYGCAVSVVGATNTVSQIAAVEAFKHPEFMELFEKSYDYRRHQAYKILNNIPGVKLKLPESGFLAWVDVSELGDSSTICKRIVDEAKVAVNDGVNYGPGGEGHIRIVLGVYRDNEVVVEALEGMAQVLNKIALEKGIK
ncbi:pyridoxal phosphate-dependent aminotransferase [Thomasclavelia cocleata]|uniref:Aminotransferase n=1 Tax=Thomasclavelia cocleata TaxID=69824 RepID=A0A1I0GZZ9_9FIRM|nr:pyridoxal phosphate-dependent aminotransferase [Thomasclavelia cocleata]MCR1961789.1 pyridoxal phosphate-dependent aminotransferase [Thomasclavelia cocleata]NDO43491.1 pyridoxal phosphate-dependent aminotransferase [Thomasclavelia cocleata]PJN80176.1 pyridoxal phosphate-dependent aminotransferase [Thomasclavelia cocleata]SET77009.1 Aspartate/methionine/tyrosine aminotransferase [Thomasclavelia cocleata]